MELTWVHDEFVELAAISARLQEASSEVHRELAMMDTLQTFF